MAIQGSLQDLERQKFVESSTRPGNAIPEVYVSNAESGGATEATLLNVLSAVDGLEGFTDGLEALTTNTNTLITATNTLLTAIRDNADQLEGFTDDIEPLLTQIRDNVDTVETILTSINNNTDTVETLITATNSLLTTIRDNGDTVESLLGLIQTQTDQLEGYTDGIEGLITSTNSLITTMNTYVDGLETLITATNSALATLNAKDFSTAAKQDLEITQLTALNAKDFATAAKQDLALTQLTAINANTDGIEALLADIESGIGNFEDTINTGNITALNDTVQVATNGSGTVSISVTGSWLGQVNFQGSYDNGVTWSNADFFVRTSGAAAASTSNANADGFIACAGYTHVRVRRSLATSGTATVYLNASNGTSLVMAYSKNGNNFIVAAIQSGTWNIGTVTAVTAITNALPAGTNLLGKVGIDQTTPGTTNKVSIGTDGTVAINAAIPAGNNNIGDVDVLTLPSLVAGTALIGKVGIDQTTPGTTNAISLQQVGGTAVTLGTKIASASIPVTQSKEITYRAVALNIASALTPTDVFTITGSGTKTVKINKIIVSGQQTTTSLRDVIILKRSTANSAGTSTTMTNVVLDSADAAATATVRAYTANPTTGTLVGNIDVAKLVVDTAAVGANASAPPMWTFEFSKESGKALVLRGTGEVAAVNLNSVTSAGGLWNFTIEWTEE